MARQHGPSSDRAHRARELNEPGRERGDALAAASGEERDPRRRSRREGAPTLKHLRVRKSSHNVHWIHQKMRIRLRQVGWIRFGDGPSRLPAPPELKLLPRAHRAISNLKAWLHGTHRGVSREHLQLGTPGRPHQSISTVRSSLGACRRGRRFLSLTGLDSTATNSLPTGNAREARGRWNPSIPFL